MSGISDFYNLDFGLLQLNVLCCFVIPVNVHFPVTFGRLWKSAGNFDHVNNAQRAREVSKESLKYFHAKKQAK